MSFSFLKIEEAKFALSVSPPYGTSIYSSRIIKRDNPRSEITESEIESVISQAIWKIFDEARMFFSKRLDISEMDVVMADVRVSYIKLDGGVVVNPVGFAARTIEVGLVEILITRSLLEQIKLSAPKKGEVVFTLEPAASCARLLQKDAKKQEFAIAHITEEQTHIYYSSDENQISYVSDFNWGVSAVLDSLIRQFSISNTSARDLLRRYALEDMSTEMIKVFKGIISEPFIEFSKGVSLAAHNVKASKLTLYILNNELSELNPRNISHKESSIKMHFLPTISYTDLALREMSNCDLQSTWNKIAKRRMRWLMCHK